MSGNQGNPLNLMDELANAGFGASKIDSSSEDFTTTLYTDPVVRLNFSDVDDITSFNEKHLQASTPLVNPSQAPIECEDATVDSDLLKVYTQKLLPSSMLQENIKPVPQSEGSEQSSNECIGLNLEQELQQAISQNGSAGSLQNNGYPVICSPDENKNLATSCSNVGLNLEQELQQAISTNSSPDVVKDSCSVRNDHVGLNLEQELQEAIAPNSSLDVVTNDCSVNNVHDISKDLITPHSNVGLNLERELQEAIAPNSSPNVVTNDCSVNNVHDISKDLITPHSNVGLNLEQELQEAIAPNSSPNVVTNDCSVNNVHDISKDLITPHSNVGLNLEQELQEAIAPNSSPNVVTNDCSVNNVHDISKDLITPHSNVGLNLEQELQEAIAPNSSPNVVTNDCSVNNVHDISKDLITPHSNVGLNLEQELQEAIAPNSSPNVVTNDCSVNNVHDISKDLITPHSNVGLNLEQELQEAIAPNSSPNVVTNDCSVNNVHDISEDLITPHSNVGLNLEQELQQTISSNDNADMIDNGRLLKNDLDSIKDEIPIHEDNFALRSNDEDTKKLEETVPINEDLFELENKMEKSVSGKTLNLKQDVEFADSSSFSNEIAKNASEDFGNEEYGSEQECPSLASSRETSKHIIKNGCTPVKDNNSNGFEGLNTLEYLGFSSEKLKSFSVSNTSNMAANSPVHLKESDDSEYVNDSSVGSNDLIGGVCNKRSIKMEDSLSLTTGASPEKKTKIDSEIKLNGSFSEMRSPEISLLQDKLPNDDNLKFLSSESSLNMEKPDYAQLKMIEILEKQLEKEQKLTTQAAELGMQLLQENGELKDKVENLFRKIATAEEERENEKHTLKLKLDNKDYMEQQYNEEISHLKDEVSKLKQDLETAEKTEMTLSRQLKSMEYSAEQFQLREQQLTTTIEHLEQLLQEKADQALHNASINFGQMDKSNTEEIIVMQQEIIELQNNNTLLKSQLISHEANMKRLQEELTLCQQSKEKKEQEIDEMKSEMNSYHKTLEAARTEILDLKAQLHAAQIENHSHKDRGNSLFSEIEDRRVLAEKTVATLQRNYQALKERYDVEKQQHHKLKMQAVSLLHMNSDKVSEDYVKQLNSMLQQAKNELQELQEKVKNYQKNEAHQTEKMVKIQETFGTNENRDFIEYLNSLTNIKQKELEELKVKLNDMEMQYLEETNKVVNYIKKLRLSEEEAQSLRCANMKLKLKLEELMMKYNPDELAEEKSLQKTCVEKIPLGPADNIAKSLMNQKPRRKTQAKVPVENQTQTRAQQIAELVRCRAINPVDVLKESHKAKKTVSLSSEVTIIDNDGKEEKKVNLVDENVPTKLERRRPPQGKLAPADKIIEVKTPVHGRADCKQQ